MVLLTVLSNTLNAATLEPVNSISTEANKLFISDATQASISFFKASTSMIYGVAAPFAASFMFLRIASERTVLKSSTSEANLDVLKSMSSRNGTDPASSTTAFTENESSLKREITSETSFGRIQLLSR